MNPSQQAGEAAVQRLMEIAMSCGDLEAALRAELLRPVEVVTPVGGALEVTNDAVRTALLDYHRGPLCGNCGTHSRMRFALEQFAATSTKPAGDMVNSAASGSVQGVAADSEREEGRTKFLKEITNMHHDLLVVMQAAWIEWRHGRGAEHGMGWIENTLYGPGLIPGEDEPYGKEAQAYFDKNKSDPFPQCFCGRPSNQLWMGEGFCGKAHYDERRASIASSGGKAE